MGWNRPKENGEAVSRPLQKRKGFRFSVKGAVVGAIVVLGAGVAAWWLSPSGETRRDAASTKRSRIKEVAPAAAPKAVEKETENAPAVTNGAPAWVNAKGLDPSLFPYKDGRKVIESTTNIYDQVIDICIMPSGRSRKVIRNAKPPVFEAATDQLIALALSGGDDERAMPMPIAANLEAEFLKSLDKPIVIKDSDSEVVKQMKQNVMEAREFIDGELRKGRSFQSILEDHLRQRNDNAELRAEAMSGAQALKKEGDPDLVNDYVKRANELLRSKGVGEIEVPMNKLERRRAQKEQNTP